MKNLGCCGNSQPNLMTSMNIRAERQIFSKPELCERFHQRYVIGIILKSLPHLHFTVLPFSSKDSPSVLILRLVLTKANKVALNITVPSLFNGMFIETNFCKISMKRVKNLKTVNQGCQNHISNGPF